MLILMSNQFRALRYQQLSTRGMGIQKGEMKDSITVIILLVDHCVLWKQVVGNCYKWERMVTMIEDGTFISNDHSPKQGGVTFTINGL